MIKKRVNVVKWPLNILVVWTWRLWGTEIYFLSWTEKVTSRAKNSSPFPPLCTRRPTFCQKNHSTYVNSNLKSGLQYWHNTFMKWPLLVIILQRSVPFLYYLPVVNVLIPNTSFNPYSSWQPKSFEVSSDAILSEAWMCNKVS